MNPGMFRKPSDFVHRLPEIFFPISVCCFAIRWVGSETRALISVRAARLVGYTRAGSAASCAVGAGPGARTGSNVVGLMARAEWQWRKHNSTRPPPCGLRFKKQHIYRNVCSSNTPEPHFQHLANCGPFSFLLGPLELWLRLSALSGAVRLSQSNAVSDNQFKQNVLITRKRKSSQKSRTQAKSMHATLFSQSSHLLVSITEFNLGCVFLLFFLKFITHGLCVYFGG